METFHLIIFQCQDEQTKKALITYYKNLFRFRVGSNILELVFQFSALHNDIQKGISHTRSGKRKVTKGRQKGQNNNKINLVHIKNDI